MKIGRKAKTIDILTLGIGLCFILDVLRKARLVFQKAKRRVDVKASSETFQRYRLILVKGSLGVSTRDLGCTPGYHVSHGGYFLGVH